MGLAPGTRVGPYEVVDLLGAGGMGEVYRAHDPKLGRDVAVKILPTGTLPNPDRLARFHREARVLATLSHPHIAAIYGLEEFGPAPAIVLELVEGPTLADQLGRGPLPLRDVLKVGRQIAEALEAAHQKGIIHRDLKPANVKVASGGVVKVLDFGLAKALESSDPTGVADDRSVETATGVVMGTVAYMSPEQTRGQLCDERTDIWAFGCVLFELLSGRGAFRRPTVSDTIAAVISSEPDWTALPKETPDGIRRLLTRCLQKDPHHRLHNIADVRIELEDEIASGKSGPIAANRSEAASKFARIGWIAGAAAIAALVAGFLLRGAGGPAASDVRITRLTDRAGLEEFPAASPDGRAVAFTAGVSGDRQLFVQLVAGGEPLQLTRDKGDHEFARWTPDSSSIVYFTPGGTGESQGTLWQVSALGGPPRRLIDSVGGADVNRDGRLTFFRLVQGGMQLVTASPEGSNPTLVAAFPAVTYYLYPRWSPDGRWIAYQRGDSIRFDVFVVSASGGEPRPMTRDNNMMAGFTWLPDSSGIVYSSSRGSTMPYLPTLSLWRVTLEGGEPRQLASSESSYVHPDLAPNGAILVGRVRMQSDLWRFPIDGPPAENVRRAERLTRQTGQVLTPTAGPGDREVAFLSDRGGHANVWVIDTGSGEWRQITHERDAAVSLGLPVWSPDGRSIAFLSTRDNPGLTFGIWLVNPDGSSLRTLVNPGLGPAWSPDGQWLYYSTRGSASAGIVMRKIRPTGGEPATVTTEQLRNVIGYDGTTVYYTFERPLVDGRPEFEIRSASPEDAPFKVLARISASRVPIWKIVNPSLSPDGTLLAQALTDRQTTNLWTLSTKSGEWRQITDFGDRTTFIARRVSWSSDGRAILAALGEGDSDIVLLDGLGVANR